jgi:hypothetical protein
MKQKPFFTCLSLLLLAAALSVAAQTQTQMTQSPGKLVVSGTTSMEATVQDIDYANRIVTLQGPQGNTVRVKVGEDAPNFNQLKKGDRVKADYYQSTALSLRKPGEAAPPSGEKTEVLVQPAQGQGQGPKRVMVNTRQVTATVQDVDYKNRIVSLKGPEGNIVQLKAGDNVQNLERIKRGDRVVATFTDALGISVSREQS